MPKTMMNSAQRYRPLKRSKPVLSFRRGLRGRLAHCRHFKSLDLFRMGHPLLLGAELNSIRNVHTDRASVKSGVICAKHEPLSRFARTHGRPREWSDASFASARSVFNSAASRGTTAHVVRARDAECLLIGRDAGAQVREAGRVATTMPLRLSTPMITDVDRRGAPALSAIANIVRYSDRVAQALRVFAQLAGELETRRAPG